MNNSIGFILENPKKLATPLPLKGQLGFFNLNENILNEMKILENNI